LTLHIGTFTMKMLRLQLRHWDGYC